MASKEESLAQIADLNAQIDAQEQRAKDLIAARDAAVAAKDAAIAEKDAANAALQTVNDGLVAHVAELDAVIVQLKAIPEVPDEVTAAIQAARDNAADNFAA